MWTNSQTGAAQRRYQQGGISWLPRALMAAPMAAQRAIWGLDHMVRMHGQEEGIKVRRGGKRCNQSITKRSLYVNMSTQDWNQGKNIYVT